MSCVTSESEESMWFPRVQNCITRGSCHQKFIVLITDVTYKLYEHIILLHKSLFYYAVDILHYVTYQNYAIIIIIVMITRLLILFVWFCFHMQYSSTFLYIL